MRSSNKTTIYITLPERFSDDIKLAAYEEMKIASSKYNVNLNDEQKEKVFYHSFRQLESKAFEVARAEWNIESPILELKIDVGMKEPKEIYMPADKEKCIGVKVLKASKKWEFDKEDSKDAILINDLCEKIPEMLLEYIKTAVMYGVGSYA